MYMGEKRSIRIRGRSTTIRLELPYWETLEKISRERGSSLAALIADVEDAFQAAGDHNQDKKNLASCLRVYCLRYHAGQAGTPDDTHDHGQEYAHA